MRLRRRLVAAFEDGLESGDLSEWVALTGQIEHLLREMGVPKKGAPRKRSLTCGLDLTKKRT